MDASLAYHQFFALKDAMDGGILLRRNYEEVAVIREGLGLLIGQINGSRSADVYPFFLVEDHDLEPVLSEARLQEVESLASRLGRLASLKASPFPERSYYLSGHDKFLAHHIATELGLVVVELKQTRLVTNRFAIDMTPAKPAFYLDSLQFLR